MCIQADALRLLLYPVYHLGEESFVYSTRCTACIVLSDISPGLKRVMYSTGCTSLFGISHTNQGNVVYSNVTVYEMFIAALEKNI